MRPLTAPRPDSRPLSALALSCLLAAGAWLAAGSAACAQEPEAASGDVAARVGEVDISFAQLEEMVASQLKSLERQRHQLLEGALEQAIERKVLELEAAKTDQSADEFVQQQVAAGVTQPTDADVDAFYESNKERITQPKEEVLPQIRQYLQQKSQQDAYRRLIEQWEKGYRVVRYLEPLRLEVDTDGSPAEGPMDAPVTIVEFSDFECPYCRRVNPTLDRIKETYGDKVRFVFRQFPLPIHGNARGAAEASLCAHEQGKFWEMHDSLFENQQSLGLEEIKGRSADLGLDAEAFAACVDGGKYAGQVDTDLAEGQELGVTGTPALFVNGRLIEGAQPFEEIAELIDDELTRASQDRTN